jgi:hypothetical protein
MLNPSSFKTTDPIVDFSIRASNDMSSFIADEVFPPVIVSKEAFKVYQYDTSNYRYVDYRSDSKAQANSVDYGVFTRSATAQLHKGQAEWDPNDAAQFDTVVANLEQDCALTIMDRLMINKEVEAATLATTTTNYSSSNTATLGAGATWIVSGGDPLTNVSTAHAAVRASTGGMSPNAAALSKTTFDALKTAPVFLDMMKYSGQYVTATNDVFASLLKGWLGVQYLHIGGALKNTNVEGNATQTLADIWGDGIVFYVKNTSVSPKTMRYGANYMWDQMYTYRYEDQNRGGPKGRIQVLELGWSYVLASAAVVASGNNDFAAGYYLANVI